MNRDYVPIPMEYLEEMACLSNEEFGALIRGLLALNLTGETPELPERAGMFWARVRNRDERYRTSFEEAARRRSEAGKAGARARWNADASERIRTDAIYGYTNTHTNTDTNTKANTNTKERESRGAPALDEVKKYGVEVSAPAETAERFFDYYTARGWMIGDRPVADWQALFRSWLSREKTKPGFPDYSCGEGESL